MHKKKFLFITFEGIEGSGKSYQSKKLYNKLKKLKKPVILTREPGGSVSAEKIRKMILNGLKNKFNDLTDTLLYLAARNEHVTKRIRPLLSKTTIICDRFTDSTLAYQVHGKKIKKNFIDVIHKQILKNIKPDLTFVLKLNISKAFKRMKKGKSKNRYDRFTKSFYQKVQNGFIKIAKTNKKRYIILDTSKNDKNVEKLIYNKFLQTIKK